MDKKIKSFAKKQNDIFKRGHRRISSNRQQWEAFSILANQTFQPVLEELKEIFEFENFYLSEGKDYSTTKHNKNQNFINFKMGSHSNGILTQTQGVLGQYSSSVSVEKGGQLVFSQGPQGEVLVIIYACSSDAFQFNDKYIVYRIYASPAKLSPKKLMRILRFYFRFIYISSYIGKITLLDRVRISLIKLRMKFDILKLGKSVIETAKTIIELKAGIISTNP